MKANKTAYQSRTLQKALFQAAKVGNIEKMKQLIEEGADPYLRDKRRWNAIFYAMFMAPEKISTLISSLKEIVPAYEALASNDNNGGNDEAK